MFFTQKTIFLFITSLFFLCTARTQNIAIEGQSIHKDGYVAYNLGNYKKGAKQNLWVEIKNESHIPLKISSLELSCDCLSASALPPFPIPAGAKFKLNIRHHAKSVGAFHVFAILKSDAQNYPELWLKFSGEVQKKNK